MPNLPIVIHKAFIGYVYIAAVGALLIAALIVGMIALATQHSLDQELYFILGAFAVLVLLATLIQFYVYSLTTITLDEQGITVVNWYSLLFSQDSQTAWTKVQDASSTQNGVLQEAFDYGTLLIQTAGTDKNFSITYVPRPDYWVNFIQEKAAATPQLTHNGS